MVKIQPMPRAYLKIPALLRPGTPPIFDSEPTLSDKREAQALFNELDQDSRDWYARNGFKPRSIIYR